ncbi:MAG: cell surface protein SprA, partial [Muribaculaceae bacterium]|nr:cell surface protein SprA [Muribaculaceae bacterium]
ILDRYKRYNGVEGNSLSSDDANEPRYQSSKNGPDVEDINLDNTLNEYERYYQYHISIRPEDLVVGKNYITDRQTSVVATRSGEPLEVEWFQFKIPLSDYEKIVGSIPDFSSIRFARIFLTGFSRPTHLRFATLELVRGQWRTYDYNIDNKGDVPAEGELDVSTVNIEENSGREPVNYVLPPGVNRMVDNGQSQAVYLNEQSMSMKVVGLPAKNARGVYKTMSLDLRNYKTLQMFTHCESLIDNVTDLTDGQLSVFIRLGSDLRQNYYEYEVPLALTEPGHYNGEIIADRYAVWPEHNFVEIALNDFVKVKEARNRLTSSGASNLSFLKSYSEPASGNKNNIITVIGNPTLGDIRVMMIGVRNNTDMTKDGIVWVNELRVTGYDSNGGWAGTADMNLSVSDIASFNFGGRIESAGFGDVDMPLANRRLDDYSFYNFAMKLDVGRFLPESLKLQAPVYYSMTRERTTPQYNPLDTDVKLKDALDMAPDKAMRDSIKNFAIENVDAQNFSVSGLRFNRTSARPKPWDPANFTANLSFNKQSRHNPTTEYENVNEYRGGLVYQYNSGFNSVHPFARIARNNFLKDWVINYFPTSIGLRTDISRYYYEQQVRSTESAGLKLPVSVNKNFLWDRQLSLTWDITRSLSVSFTSMTTARIDESPGAVNRKLFPDQYKQWKDTVVKSLLSMGKPLGYNQVVTASYRLPFSQIKALNFITAGVTYNATYRWVRGASLRDIEIGNNIFNQAILSIDGRVSFEDLYNKSHLLKTVSRRFGANSRRAMRQPVRSYRRAIKLLPDTTITVVHNLRTRNVRLKAFDRCGNQIRLQSSPDGINKLIINSRADSVVNIEITPVEDNQFSVKNSVRDYALRLMMSPRHAAVRWRRMSGLSLPLFRNDIGNIFGQSQRYGAMSPGLGFAFGFTSENYVETAKRRGWLVTDNGMSTPAIWSTTDELNLELNLEPIRGFRVRLVMNRTDNRNSSIQFISDNFQPLMSGAFTMTTSAIATSLASSSFKNGYKSGAFERMLSNIGEIEQRQLKYYHGMRYPSAGFMVDNPVAGNQFSTEVSTFNRNSSDILIPAFVSAYTGIDVTKVTLNPFPKFNAVIPNWSITYDGLSFIEPIRALFKSVVLNHAYQCTYSVGLYSSFPQWVEIGSNIGFIPSSDGATPIPSSPYNIMSVAISERFAPLIGLKVVMHNNLSLNAEYRDRRTLTLNTAASQVVEATQRGFAFGAGYKIVGLNLFYRHRKRQSSFSNDLTVNADFSFQNSQALVRRIETIYTQATSGARTLTMNLAANYALSRLATIGLFIDHQINTPIVAMYTFPTTTTSYGITVNLSLM